MLMRFVKNRETLEISDCETYSDLTIAYRDQNVSRYISQELTQLYEALPKRFVVSVQLEKSSNSGDSIECKCE